VCKAWLVQLLQLCWTGHNQLCSNWASASSADQVRGSLVPLLMCWNIACGMSCRSRYLQLAFLKDATVLGACVHLILCCAGALFVLQVITLADGLHQ
jgi:hypothetical protein